MKGFGIYVKNNLLEPKHIENMDAAVWLYLWLLDKMTSVNENGVGKVLGGQPITYSLINAELGLSERTYQRWVSKLRETGYIKTIRTPYGLVITVNKAEKIFSSKRTAKSGVSKKLSVTPKVAEHSKRDTPNMAERTAKSGAETDKYGGSNKTIQDNTINNTNTTSVVADGSGLPPLPSYGKPEISELFSYWAQACQFNIESRVQANRRAASNLFKKYGTEKMHQLIDGVALTHSDQYAPRISDFCALQQKLPDLIVWGRKKHGSSPVEVIS
jgi:DNA-binding Lrp family transcriptional regulator